ncbi:MAG: hypothetical protein JSW71_20745 [Gemmatimonadota bacterium]|nr:MAG: hypothetical protein JSW71_20745 [Gemmatimonadota bacterium]
MLRRLLHASSATVLLIPMLGSWSLLRVTLVVAAVMALLMDVARIRLGTLGHRVERLVPVFRTGEAGRLNGATWLCIGYALSGWFPPMATAAGILAGALADPAASLVGGWAGRSRAKTASGSLAALAVSFVALWLLGLSWPAVLGGAVVGTVLERWPGPFDDNVLIAPGVACIVWLIA